MPKANYPTREAILARVPRFPSTLVHQVQILRRLWPKCTTGEQKFNLLRATLFAIDHHHNRHPQNKLAGVIFNPKLGSGCYDRGKRTIFLANDSIITALHELAHHLLGPSELMACRWSVHLFKAAWPSAFAKLKWDGHLLKK